MTVQPLHVLRDAFFDAGERCVVAGLTQLTQVGLGEALVLSLQRLGERDVFDETLLEQGIERFRRFALQRAAAIDVGGGEFVEALRPPGTDVKNSRLVGVVEEEQIDLGHVADIDRLEFGVWRHDGDHRRHADHRRKAIDELINANAKGWKTTRMNKVDLSILRLAVYEMKWDDEVPVGVAINEAVELAKMFSSDEAPSFINGVLGKIARSLEETKE